MKTELLQLQNNKTKTVIKKDLSICSYDCCRQILIFLFSYNSSQQLSAMHKYLIVGLRFRSIFFHLNLKE